MIRVVRAKFHGITVTGADLDYHGSITLDPEQCDLAGIRPLEFVDIWNKASGARIQTYVIFGEPGSRACVLNGAAARTCARGDQVIICASAYIDEPALHAIEPVVLTFTPDNQVDQVMRYRVRETERRRFDFALEMGERSAPAKRPVNRVDLDAFTHDLRRRGLDDHAIADVVARHLKAVA
ncbi:aspartate 1-decarboxylase [Tistrella mobilis]|uniref:aspartate 1-decarboxylase n=1 Tax=Tistrella mobilis TaxID=171437 RepID=UPI0031F63553